MANEFVLRMKKADSLADKLMEDIYNMDPISGSIDNFEKRYQDIKEHYLQVFDVVKPNSEEELEYYLHFVNFFRLLTTLLIEKGGVKSEQQYKNMMNNGLVVLEEGIKESKGNNKAELIKEKEIYLKLLNETWQKYKPAKKGCYIATAVYGSYDCSQVWTLRRFRDNCLSQYALGRLFIRIYYAISPSIVKRFGRSKWIPIRFRRPDRGRLRLLPRGLRLGAPGAGRRALIFRYKQKRPPVLE